MAVDAERSGRLLTSGVNGNETLPFFDAERCGVTALDHKINAATLVQPVTAVDWSDSGRPRLIWIWYDREEVWSSDWSGCNSKLELNSTDLKRKNIWPPSSLAVDRFHFYWSDAEGRLYKTSRSLAEVRTKMLPPTSVGSRLSNALMHKPDVVVEPVYGVRKIATLGYSNQPLPGQFSFISTLFIFHRYTLGVVVFKEILIFECSGRFLGLHCKN